MQAPFAALAVTSTLDTDTLKQQRTTPRINSHLADALDDVHAAEQRPHRVPRGQRVGLEGKIHRADPKFAS